MSGHTVLVYTRASSVEELLGKSGASNVEATSKSGSARGASRRGGGGVGGGKGGGGKGAVGKGGAGGGAGGGVVGGKGGKGAKGQAMGGNRANGAGLGVRSTGSTQEEEVVASEEETAAPARMEHDLAHLEYRGGRPSHAGKRRAEDTGDVQDSADRPGVGKRRGVGGGARK